MNSSKKHRKLFYVPGMISLIVLPLTCLWFINSRGYLKEYKAMNYYIDESYCNKKIKESPKSYLRNNLLFEFNSSIDNERLKLVKLENELRKLNKSNDSINGLRLHFGKKTSYELFIRVLDILAIEKAETYYQIKDDLFVLGNIKRPSTNVNNIKGFECGYAYANREFFAEKARKEQLQMLIKLLLQNKIVLMAYLGIIFLNILTLLNFQKNKRYDQKSYL